MTSKEAQLLKLKTELLVAQEAMRKHNVKSDPDQHVRLVYKVDALLDMIEDLEEWDRLDKIFDSLRKSDA